MGDSLRTGRASGPAFLLLAGLILTACQPAEPSGDGGDMSADQEAMSSVTSEEMIQMERGLWEALAAGEYATFGEHLADDMQLIGGEGVISKQDFMGSLEGASMESYEVGDFQVSMPGSGVAIVTYSYSETFRPADADSAVDYSGWATSVWENRDGTWLTVLHQSSEAPPSMEE